MIFIMKLLLIKLLDT